jgi:hypothetical protein
MRTKTLIGLLITSIGLCCQSHKHTLTDSYLILSKKELSSWIKSWKKQTQMKLSNTNNDTCKIIQACYTSFFLPGKPQLYQDLKSYNSKTTAAGTSENCWIIQGKLAYLILPGKITFPDTADLNKNKILNHYRLLTKTTKPDTLKNGEFLSRQNTPGNWLLLDPYHQKEISNFLGNASDVDSVAEMKRAFLKPYFTVGYTHDRSTPLHKKHTWVPEAQPEIMLMAFDSSLKTVQLFFMDDDLEIGFAVMTYEQNKWKMIYTKLDYWDQFD